MTPHRDRVTNLNEVEWLIATGGVVSLLVIDIIEDGSRSDAFESPGWRLASAHRTLRLVLSRSGSTSQVISPSFYYAGGGYSVPPSADGWREPSRGEPRLGPTGFHPTRLRAPLA